MAPVEGFIEETSDRFVDQFTAAVPRIVSGLLFLVVAYLAVRVILALARETLERWYGDDEQLVAELGVTVLAVFLWFGVGLTFLKIVGMGDIAVSLGTATGFIALGVSYALSDMIEDTVSGVYLLRDPDFNIGDRVTTGSVTGTVAAIELRKSRIETDDGNRAIIANRDIEARWTYTPSEEGDEGTADENA